MPLKLMYITNNPDVAKIVEAAGVDQIFIDMEYIGKADRQGGMDTVQSHHTVDDVKRIKEIVSTAEIMVRINPIHGATERYGSSKEEIDAVIDAGADIIMLPYFKTVAEVAEFIRLVGGRAKTFPLLETPEAVDVIDEILELEGLDQIHIGINDLSLGYGKKFMFELLSDGTIEKLCSRIAKKGIPYGFGGIAALGKGMLPAEYILKEHYRIGSSFVILSRSFCNTNSVTDLDKIKEIFDQGVKVIRLFEEECKQHVFAQDTEYFEKNKIVLNEKVQMVLEHIGRK